MPQSRSRHRWSLFGLTPALAMVVSCSAFPFPSEKPIVQPKPPPAVAPPDPGVAAPPVRLLDPATPALGIEQRPQKQLTGWAKSMSPQLNIPQAALQAYGYAARAADAEHPGCGLSWPVLAGIGAIETSHGRYGGSELDGTGRPSNPIRGLPLNGDGVKSVPDTDGGQLDGDPHVDRAVGPLQFIPDTWREHGRDADGDGVADPNDIDDAALTAAGYLCEAGGDLRQPEPFWQALLAYNRSESYGQDVLDHADQYGRKSRELAVEW